MNIPNKFCSFVFSAIIVPGTRAPAITVPKLCTMAPEVVVNTQFVIKFYVVYTLINCANEHLKWRILKGSHRVARPILHPSLN